MTFLRFSLIPRTTAVGVEPTPSRFVVGRSFRLSYAVPDGRQRARSPFTFRRTTRFRDGGHPDRWLCLPWGDRRELNPHPRVHSAVLSAVELQPHAARRDLNPQPSDLSSDGVPCNSRASGLKVRAPSAIDLGRSRTGNLRDESPMISPLDLRGRKTQKAGRSVQTVRLR